MRCSKCGEDKSMADITFKPTGNLVPGTNIQQHVGTCRDCVLAELAGGGTTEQEGKGPDDQTD